jgi:alkylation response protein AidB-like acyl-CoA dehydrogenase
MDFSFTEEQEDLRGLAQRILEDKLTEERMREVEAGVERFDRDTYAALAKANLLGIALPEDVGGSGYGIVEQCLVLEQVGRTVAPVPVLPSIVMGAMPIAEFGSPEQKAAWAAPAAEGDKVLTAALIEPLDAPPTRATREGDGWRIDGVKTCVPAGTYADLILVPAGTQVFLVEPSTKGVTVERQMTSNKEAEARITFDGVRVGPDALLEGDGIVHWIIQRATLGLVATQLGVLSRAVEMTAEYSKTRVQFDRPIATFQAVGQRMADAYIDVEAVRLTLIQAMWRLAEGLPADTEIEVAKYWAADAGHRVAHTAVHIHGGVGIDVDYPLHRYFVAAKKNEFTLGGATEQLLRIGSELAEVAG